jgi:hypothetical protein
MSLRKPTFTDSTLPELGSLRSLGVAQHQPALEPQGLPLPPDAARTTPTDRDSRMILRSKAILCLVLGLLLGVADHAGAQSSSAVLSCAKRVGKAAKGFTGRTLETLGDCYVDSLKDEQRTDCRIDEDVADEFESAAEKLRREVRKCNDDALRAICPMGARDDTAFKEAALDRVSGMIEGMLDFTTKTFVTSYGGCSRPPGEISREAEDCADKISRISSDSLDEFHKCVMKCELNAMRRNPEEPCLNEFTGAPNDSKIVECYERMVEEVRDLTLRCEDSHLVELGCPLGESVVAEIDGSDQITGGLAGRLVDRLYGEVTTVSNALFHSECAGGGGGTEGGPTEPAAGTLYPSLRSVELNCGQILDEAFFEDDNELRLDSHLNCGPAGVDSIGIIVAASDVSIDGRENFDIVGPSRSSNRTGTGILIAAGARNVTISRFRAIQRYAVGIGDEGDNRGLKIENLTVRRNRAAGIRTTSPSVVVSDVKADRNAIGFDMGGDGSTLIDSRALRSEPDPAIGIRLTGTDDDGNGRVVRVNRCDVEGNRIGIHLEAGPHMIEENDVRSNIEVGISVASDGSKLEDNGLKFNGTDGILISGHFNLVVQNDSDENFGSGFRVTGTGNDLNGNGSGSPNRGNLQHGFVLAGSGNIIDTNRSEGNAGDGFLVAEDTAVFKSNDALGNEMTGVNVVAAGNELETNRSENNGLLQFFVASGNTDRGGNNASGETIAFGLEGGSFE